MPLACVIGNSAANSPRPLPLVERDVDAVLKFFDDKGVTVVNKGGCLALPTDQMRRTILDFLEACKASEGPYYFYFSGHAFERDDDIHLVGEEAKSLDTPSVLQAFRLKDYLVELGNLEGLKIVVLDACRTSVGDDDGEGFERLADALLQNIPDLILITSASSGETAYDGKFTLKLVGELNKLEAADLPVPLQTWLDAMMSKLVAELSHIQRPALSQILMTQDWTLADVVGVNSNAAPTHSHEAPAKSAGRHPNEGRDVMSLKQLSHEQVSAYLTDIRSNSGGSISGLFLFSSGELEAADFSAYRDDTMNRLAHGYSVVESSPVRTTCTNLEGPGRAVSRDESGHFGDLKAIIFGFARSIITMTVPEPGVHLLGLYHPKDRYRYGMALNAQEDVLAAVKAGKSTTYSADKKKTLRESGQADFANAISVLDPIATPNLLMPQPTTLSATMSEPEFASSSAGIRGFVLLEQSPDREKKKIIRSISSSLGELQSQPGKPSSYRYRNECAPLASPHFAHGILDALVAAQHMLVNPNAKDVEAVTGPLRTFWLSFDKAVIGVNPFEERKHGKLVGQHFLLSVYISNTVTDRRFNYGEGRQLIRRLCEAASNARP